MSEKQQSTVINTAQVNNKLNELHMDAWYPPTNNKLYYFTQIHN